MQHRLACLCLARLLLTRQQEGPDVLKTHRHTTKANTGVNSCCVRLISLDTTEVGGLAAQQPTAVDPAHISADTKQDARPVGHRPTAAAAPFKGSDKNCVTRTQNAGHVAQQPTAAIVAHNFQTPYGTRAHSSSCPFQRFRQQLCHKTTGCGPCSTATYSSGCCFAQQLPLLRLLVHADAW
jgi:hypothetical protein